MLKDEKVSSKGEFNSFSNITSLPRPTQTPRPKFYIAATQTPESFEFAGRKGYSLMAIPIGPIGPLLELYRKSWRDAGHPGDVEEQVRVRGRQRCARYYGVAPLLEEVEEAPPNLTGFHGCYR